MFKHGNTMGGGGGGEGGGEGKEEEEDGRCGKRRLTLSLARSVDLM